MLLALLALVYPYLHQTPLKVRATTVERGPIRSLVSTNGKIEPLQNQNFEAHAPISTTIKHLLVKEGDHVRKGQLLVQLDDADIRTQAARAQAQVKTAQADQSASDACSAEPTNGAAAIDMRSPSCPTSGTSMIVQARETPKAAAAA